MQYIPIIILIHVLLLEDVLMCMLSYEQCTLKLGEQ